MTFANPIAFALFIPSSLVLWYQWRKQVGTSLPFSSIEAARQPYPTWRLRLRHLPPVLWWCGLAALIIALARPQIIVVGEREETEGIAIALLLDVSSSMEIKLDHGERRITRFELAKEVLEQFILGDGETLSGRPNDLIGLFTFARYADTASPLTRSHQALVQIIREMPLGARPYEDGTAFGDATALAAARLKKLDQAAEMGDFPAVETKVIILLSDGENNSGTIAPPYAATFAAQWGIRIYSIILSDQSIEAMESTSDPTQRAIDPFFQAVDTLREMARITEGSFRSANDFQSLRAVYDEINRLETSRTTRVRSTYPVEWFHWFLIPSLILISLSLCLRHSLLRQIP